MWVWCEGDVGEWGRSVRCGCDVREWGEECGVRLLWESGARSVR